MRISDWSSDVCSSDLEEASINAHGSSSSAGDEVEAAWRDRIDDAVAVLKTLREHEEEMGQTGDAAMSVVKIGDAVAGEEEARCGGADTAGQKDRTRWDTRKGRARNNRKDRGRSRQ